MAISNVDIREEYVASAGQDEFAFSFKFWELTEVKVYLNGDLVDPNDYVVTPNISMNGGLVTLDTPAALNDQIIILRDVAASRSIDYVQLGLLDASALNKDFDRLWAEIQEIKEVQARSLRCAENVFGISSITIPQPISSAFLGATSDALGVEWLTISAVGAVVDASTTQKGIVELATNAEAQAMASTDRVIVASNLAALTPTESRAGLFEASTDAEASAGLSDSVAITPLKLKNWATNNGGGSDKLFTFLYFGG